MSVEGNLTLPDGAYLKNRIEQVLSEILSDKYECKVTLKFQSKGEKEYVQGMGGNTRDGGGCRVYTAVPGGANI